MTSGMKLKPLFLYSFALVAAINLLSCGKDKTAQNEDKVLPKLNGLEYVALEKAALNTAAADVVSGSGTLVFRYPRPDEDSNYKISFSLEPQGTLTLVANADDKLNGGVRVTFKRGAADKLTLELTPNKNSDITADFPPQNAAGALTFNIDLHGHGHAKFIGIGDVKEFGFTKVTTKFWGMILNKASVTKALADKAELPD